MKGIRIPVRLEIETQLPAVQITRKTYIRISQLFRTEIIADVTEVDGPVGCEAHAAHHVDRMSSDESGVLPDKSPSLDPHFVADAEVA